MNTCSGTAPRESYPVAILISYGMTIDQIRPPWSMASIQGSSGFLRVSQRELFLVIEVDDRRQEPRIGLLMFASSSGREEPFPE